MRKALTLIIIILSIATQAESITITTDQGILGLYGVEFQNGRTIESYFQNAIATAQSESEITTTTPTLTKPNIKNEYLNGTLGYDGFIFCANYEAPGSAAFGTEFLGFPIAAYENPLQTIILGNWNIWWTAFDVNLEPFLDDITKLFADIKYGETFIYEEMDRESSSPVPEPTTMLLLGFGLIGLSGILRKPQLTPIKIK